ncbi:hypothetical protein [Bdellovibrio bacteriovorus]|uniref:hypothetical protein n=1 Tax=Bdellovibrio TaxID=958 RepID=UPI0035A90658
MWKNNLILIPLLILVASTNAWSEPKKEASSGTSKKSRRVKLNFEDELVTGSTAKPDVSNLNTKTDFNYKKLIRVRENFVNEMENGLNDFKGN